MGWLSSKFKSSPSRTDTGDTDNREVKPVTLQSSGSTLYFMSDNQVVGMAQDIDDFLAKGQKYPLLYSVEDSDLSLLVTPLTNEQLLQKQAELKTDPRLHADRIQIALRSEYQRRTKEAESWWRSQSMDSRYFACESAGVMESWANTPWQNMPENVQNQITNYHYKNRNVI